MNKKRLRETMKAYAKVHAAIFAAMPYVFTKKMAENVLKQNDWMEVTVQSLNTVLSIQLADNKNVAI